MKLSKDRKGWLKVQLNEFKECHLMNFGDSGGWDVHGDLCDLLDDCAQLETAVQAAVDYFEDGITNKEQYRAYERFVEAVQPYLTGDNDEKHS